MANNKTGKNSKAAAMGKLIAGLRKHFTNGQQQLTLDGATVTVDAAVNEVQAFIDNRAAVVAAQATAKAAVAAERSALPALNAFIDALIAFVRLTLGPTAAALADFGIAQEKKRTPMTAEQKAVAAAKREATRKARGTQGARAKKAVHGDITAKLVVTPVTPDPAPAPAVPATSAPAAPVAAPAPTPPKG